MATSTLGSGTLVLAGTTSGTTTVTATAVAGTTTLTLPAATDTLVGKATTDTLTNKTLTGAVMNGTLGATTPSTVAATTLTTSSTVTHNGGTANGVAYLNGSKVLTTGSALVFDGTNLGVGVTPSAWGSAFKVLQLANGTSLSNNGQTSYYQLGANNYFDGSDYKYIASNYAGFHRFSNAGAYEWHIAASGTAGNTISFTQAMTLDASGNLGIGTTSPSNFGNANNRGLTVNGQGTAGFLELQSSGTAYGAVYANSSNAGIRSITALPLTFETNATERARIDSSGLMLVGTTSQLINESTLSLLSVANTMSVKTTGGAGSVPILCWNNAASGTINLINFFYGSTITAGGTITTNGTVTTLNNPSDYRLKNITGALTTSGAFIDALKPLVGTYKSNGSAFVGFVADQLQEVSPSSVQGEKDAVDEKGNPVYQSLAYASPEIITNLVAEIQSLRKRLAAANL